LPSGALLEFAFAFALASLGCSKPALLPRAHATSPEPIETNALDARGAPSPPGANSAAKAASATPDAASPVPLCSPTSPASAPAATAFTRLHAGRVLSAAVGTPPRAAVWSGETATLFEGATARALPAPKLPAGAAVEIFFGRDNQPRLMGFSPGDGAGEIPVYLRFRHGVFRPEPSELGPLGAPRGALYGVLGFADPEVVCRPRELCLVKRTSGWGRVAAHDAPARIVLSAGSVFALHAAHLERLDERGWSRLEPARAFERPVAAWLAPNGELWVADRSAGGLFRLKSGQWEVVASPVAEPRAIFGRSERSLFVVGQSGAAEFDGARFRCVQGVDGPLHLALAVGDEVWLAGENGVYRGSYGAGG
jgi:hypothetical protein